jgi:hypothetical protein
MKYPLSIIAMFIGLNSFALCTNDKKQNSADCCRLMGLAKEITKGCFWFSAYTVADYGLSAVELPMKILTAVDAKSKLDEQKKNN